MSAVVLSLEDETLDTVLQIDYAGLDNKEDVNVIINHFNRLFRRLYHQKISSLQSILNIPKTMRYAYANLNKFDKRLYENKLLLKYNPDDIIAYRLLKSTYLSKHHEKLIKAVNPELQYDLMKDQLQKTFSDELRHIPTKNEAVIKTRHTFLPEEFNEMLIQHKHQERLIVEPKAQI